AGSEFGRESWPVPGDRLGVTGINLVCFWVIANIFRTFEEIGFAVRPYAGRRCRSMWKTKGTLDSDRSSVRGKINWETSLDRKEDEFSVIDHTVESTTKLHLQHYAGLRANRLRRVESPHISVTGPGCVRRVRCFSGGEVSRDVGVDYDRTASAVAHRDGKQSGTAVCSAKVDSQPLHLFRFACSGWHAEQAPDLQGCKSFPTKPAS